MDCAALASFTHTRHTRSAAPPNQAIGGGTKKRGYQGVSLRWDPLRQLGQLAGWVEFLEKYACFGHSLVPFGGEGCVAGMAPADRCGPRCPHPTMRKGNRRLLASCRSPWPGGSCGAGLCQIWVTTISPASWPSGVGEGWWPAGFCAVRKYSVKTRFVPPRAMVGRIIFVTTHSYIESCGNSSHCARPTPPTSHPVQWWDELSSSQLIQILGVAEIFPTARASHPPALA
jgi:hypothetical protein